MDTNTLKGVKLRKAVAKAIGWKVFREDLGETLGNWLCEDPSTGIPHSFTRHGFAPDLNWLQGGPIIERKRLIVRPEFGRGEWRAESLSCEGIDDAYGTGPTLLIAAMRAVVACDRHSF